MNLELLVLRAVTRPEVEDLDREEVHAGDQMTSIRELDLNAVLDTDALEGLQFCAEHIHELNLVIECHHYMES